MIYNDYFDENIQHKGRHFYIRHDEETQNYFIKDLGNGFGIFYKLEKPLVLQD